MPFNKISGIYEIVNKVNGNRYVGSSVDVGMRWKAHKYSLRHRQKTNSHLQRAWDKYGEDAFYIDLIVRVPIPSLRYIEQVFLNEEMGEYNVAPHADAPHRGVKMSKSQAEAIRKRMIGNQYGKGHYPSEETRRKMSISRLGNKNGLNHKHTIEHKLKVSAFTESEVRIMRWLKQVYGYSGIKIANMMGGVSSTVNTLLRGDTYQWVEVSSETIKATKGLM